MSHEKEFTRDNPNNGDETSEEIVPRRFGVTQVKRSLLFRIDKTSLGVSRIGVATPRDDCPYAKSNANTFVRARAYRVFLTSCVGINLGDIPRGLRHPRDVPSVDPSTLGRKTLYELASLKYCYRVFPMPDMTRPG